jgi:hypothetical protein
MEQTLLLCYLIFALGQLVQSVELLKTPALWSDDGAFRWGVQAKMFKKILIIRILTLIIIGIFWCQPAMQGFGLAAIMIWLWILNFAIFFKFRGSLSGGSDSMQTLTMTALLAYLVGKNISSNPHLIGVYIIYFIGAQSLLSYFLAGFYKLKQPAWRTGVALHDFLCSTIYSSESSKEFPLFSPAILRVLSWILIFAEISFPILLVTNTLPVEILLIFGIGFHLLNAYWFGINRFVYAWAATYPCLFFIAKNIH